MKEANMTEEQEVNQDFLRELELLQKAHEVAFAGNGLQIAVRNLTAIFFKELEDGALVPTAYGFFMPQVTRLYNSTDFTSVEETPEGTHLHEFGNEALDNPGMLISVSTQYYKRVFLSLNEVSYLGFYNHINEAYDFFEASRFNLDHEAHIMMEEFKRCNLVKVSYYQQALPNVEITDEMVESFKQRAAEGGFNV